LEEEKMKKKIVIVSIALVVVLGGIFGVKSAVSVFNSFVEKQQAHNQAMYELTQQKAESWYNRAIQTIDDKRTANDEFFEELGRQGEEEAKWREENEKRLMEEAAKIEAEKEATRQSWANQNTSSENN